MERLIDQLNSIFDLSWEKGEKEQTCLPFFPFYPMKYKNIVLIEFLL